MSVRIHVLAATFVLAFASFGLAQTVFVEIEPNGTKPEATPIVCLSAGDALSGASTGTSTAAGNASLSTADTFRVKTCVLPAGIYRHTLTLTTSAGTLPTATIRGRNQTAGVVGTFDNSFQFSVGGRNTWYGFGRGEEIHYRVTGFSTSTGNYTSTLTTVPVSATTVAGSFNPGPITIDASGQGHTTDTDLWLYDAALTPLVCGGNDDKVGFQSKLTLSLSAGTYYLAISTFNLANNLPSPIAANCPDPDNYTDGVVLDFPDVIADGDEYTSGQGLQFSVSDGANTTIQPATKAAIFDVAWFRIQVALTSSAVTPFCFGDGSGTACPCGNAGMAGAGCASSVSAVGGGLAGSGLASMSADTFVLTGSLLPNSFALYFQGTARVNGGAGSAFGDGLRCAGGATIRLGTQVNVGGTSSYPSGGSTPISIRGANAAGAVRDYQCWYRNAAAFCTASTFNLTNGVEVSWVP